MYSFIVLGLIPGTQVQISFAMWLIAAACVLALAVTAYMRRKHVIAFFILGLRLRSTIRHRQLA